MALPGHFCLGFFVEGGEDRSLLFVDWGFFVWFFAILKFVWLVQLCFCLLSCITCC